MPVIVIIEKNGNLKEVSLNTFDSEILYKKAGFKSATDFKKQYTYAFTMNKTSYTFDLYGKLNGKANQENKYDLPPPMDDKLFFGNCVLVQIDAVTQNVLNLSVNEWETFYEYLFGGFEDLDEDTEDDEDDAEEDDIDITDPAKVTKEGYVKDDFVVDDDEVEEVEEEEEADDTKVEEEEEDEEEDDDEDDDEEEDEDEDEDEEEDDEEEEATKKRATLNSKKTSTTRVLRPRPTKAKVEPDISYLECGIELEEEEYIYTIEDFKPHLKKLI
jgi:hypothetical protein